MNYMYLALGVTIALLATWNCATANDVVVVSEKESKSLPAWSCQNIVKSNKAATSGEYYLLTDSGTIKVYCEMGLNGGGYTFLNAESLATLTDNDVQKMITDRASLLMRVRKADGTQHYAVLQQLQPYSSYTIVIKKDAIPPGYTGTANSHHSYMGVPNLYFAFLPASPQRDVLGIRVNGASVTYAHCDPTMASYFSFFPNFQERPAAPNNHGSSPWWKSVLSNSRLNPSCRGLPESYYMFMETHFGGCGVYTDTIAMIRQDGVTGIAMGFR